MTDVATRRPAAGANPTQVSPQQKGANSSMSLRMAMLSLVAAEPRAAYDITKDFQGLLTFVWHAKPAQIYPGMRRLAEEGLLEQVEAGPRGRRVFRITDAGLAELRAWLIDSSMDHSQRNEPLLRTFSLWLLSREEALAYLVEEAEFNRLRLKGLRRIGEQLSGDVPVQRAWFLGVEAGIRRLEAQIEWAEWAHEQVSEWPDVEPQLSQPGAIPNAILGDNSIA